MPRCKRPAGAVARTTGRRKARVPLEETSSSAERGRRVSTDLPRSRHPPAAMLENVDLALGDSSQSRERSLPLVGDGDLQQDADEKYASQDVEDGTKTTEELLLPAAYQEAVTSAERDRNRCDHLVQFYETEEHLYNVITSFVVPCSASEDAVIVLATQMHLDALEMRIREQRLNLDAKRRSMQLTLIEADHMLSKVMPNNVVNGNAFNHHVGHIVRTVQRRYRKIYIYGELVNLLCSRDNHKAALQLEILWSSFIRGKEITLLCGYDLNLFKNHANKGVFQDICNTHSHITPTEKFTKHKTASQQAAAVAALEQKAKALEVEVDRRKATELALQDALRILSSRAGQALSFERDSYYSLLSVLPVGVFGTSERFETAEFFFNHRFCEITGRSAHQLHDSGFLPAVHPEDCSKVTANWTSWNAGEGIHGKLEYRFAHPDGQVLWVTAETVANRRGYVHTVVDITDIKRMEQEKLSAQRAAEEFQRQRALDAEQNKRHHEQFLDTLCHELRNPLGAITGNLDLAIMGMEIRSKLLSKGTLTNEDTKILRQQLDLDAESFSTIEKCVAHQKIISDDVLRLSKMESGKIVMQNISFEPKALLKTVAKMFDVQARKKGTELRLDLPNVNLCVTGDPDRLRQVVINLLTNAIKFTENGCITIKLDIKERKANHVVLMVNVRDTGRGMTEGEKASLFNKFQCSSESSLEYGVSGLGLYISKSLVELMGGQISVESRKGEGTQFSFTVQCVDVSGEPMLPDAPFLSRAAEISPLPGARTVLIVEDNHMNQRFMSRLLELAGYRCAIAHNGQQAVEMVKTTHFDAVLMDVEMPVMNGIQATAEIRRGECKAVTRSRVPIIGLSGNARDEHRCRSISAGMDDYLTKPVRREEILAVLNRALVAASAEA